VLTSLLFIFGLWPKIKTKIKATNKTRTTYGFCFWAAPITVGYSFWPVVVAEPQQQ
jgi:hypothetical protein